MRSQAKASFARSTEGSGSGRRLALLSALALLASLAFGTPVRAADGCPNAAFRTGFAANLPDCRAYELVNPPSRDYGDVMRMVGAGDDGDHTGFTTMVAGDKALGAQIGSYMLAHRTPAGWVTEDANAALVQGTAGLIISFLNGFSADRTKAIVSSIESFDPRDVNNSDDIYMVDVGLGTTHLLSYGPTGNTGGFGTRPLGASSDFSRVVLMAGAQPLLPEVPPYPGMSTAEGPIYVREGDDLQLVTVLPDGSPTAATLPSGAWTDRGVNATDLFASKVAHGGMRAVSDDARRVFFNTGSWAALGPLLQRDMTVSPPRTVAVSASEKAGDVGTEHPAKLIGASSDGSVAYIESAAELTDAATPGGGIYRFELNAPAGQRLEQLTPANPEPGMPGGVGDLGGLSLRSAIVSDDATHVYFTTTAVLTPGAVPGVVNAYVWSGGSTRLVASLGTGAVARVSRDGRFAIFTSKASVNGATNDGHTAIYVYDESAGELACASCRPDGTPSQGDSFLADYPHAPIPTGLTQPRNIADDGTVFFGSADTIVNADQTAFFDVYQYRAGEVSLLTAGQGNRSSFPGDNSDDGKTVFVMSPTPLLPQDRDANELDAYAVRVGGGFPQPPTPAAGCEGEACRGAVSTPPSAAAPVTPNFVGPGNSQSGRNQVKKKKKKVRKKQKTGQQKTGQKKSQKQGQKRDASRNGRIGR
ncbi:MAG TPA: hypothetical protein VFX85_04415 [Solirubrobacterales bacterium]|nr:hypothetical protein [Solirubrobacterales bacterium]